jgi:predicted nucleic acid-binding protein
VILVDTSVLVEHRRSGLPRLATLLQGGEVRIHPSVIGELACGNLRNRSQVLELLQGLPVATVASDAEVLLLIEREQLMGRGIGYIDAHLLAAARLSHCRLWTQDRRLAAVAEEQALAACTSEKRSGLARGSNMGPHSSCARFSWTEMPTRSGSPTPCSSTAEVSAEGHQIGVATLGLKTNSCSGTRHQH